MNTRGGDRRAHTRDGDRHAHTRAWDSGEHTTRGGDMGQHAHGVGGHTSACMQAHVVIHPEHTAALCLSPDTKSTYVNTN